MSDSLQTKIGILLDNLYGQHLTKPRSFFFEAVFEALPELEELDPNRVRQMVAQNEVDHASHAEETLRHLVARSQTRGEQIAGICEACGTGACAGGATLRSGQSTARSDYDGQRRAFPAERLRSPPLKF